MRSLIALLSLLALPLGTTVFAAETDSIGRHVDDFSLLDSTGQTHQLDDFANSKVVVAVFLGTECPLAALYTPRLTELYERFRREEVAIIGIDSNQQDSVDDIARFVREHDVPFPILKDPDNKIADRFGAQRTPEALVLDDQRVIRYHGRIDDQFAVGLQKPTVKRRDLAIAIEELLADKPVAVPTTNVPGCYIGRVRQVKSSDGVTYNGEIAKILQNRCVECHREGEIGPFALTDYDEIVGWAETLREVIDNGRMPPWFANPEYGEFVHDGRMSDEEKQIFGQWVEAGCPEGDPDARPEPRSFDELTDRGPLDLVYPMGNEPFEVPADGVVDYQYYAIDPGWTEDQWVTRVDAIPGARSVVHHILVFMQRPGVRYAPIYPGELIGGFVPGMRPTDLPEGTAMRIPAGAKIVFQMHYTPNGTPQSDLSHVGFRLADEETTRFEASSPRAINVLFQIPPHASDYQATASYRFRRDAHLLALTPHMHLRGKSFRYEAIYPNGEREILLDVPKWDFNWQLQYVLAEPKSMPAGTEILCTATYDNSQANPANPDPTSWVTFGEQTGDEMLIGFFVMAESRESSHDALVGSAVPDLLGLVDELRPKRPRQQNGDQADWTESESVQENLAERASGITKKSIAILQHARDGGLVKDEPLLDEIEHILLGGIAEAKKQQVLSGGSEPNGSNLGRGIRFLSNMNRAFRAIGSEGTIKTTNVQPVTLPKE